ncbi:MAG TPA: hypothetical protein VG841_07425 [Caulobacterales bacterium]|nr:hypothetical protein [Caulobacterales bacterium]
MTPALALRLAFAAAVALIMLGALTAWSAGHAVKRVIGVLSALGGAIAALAALGVTDALLAGVGVSVVVLVIAAALVVRAQEAYGGVEIGEIDVADTLDEAKAPEA